MFTFLIRLIVFLKHENEISYVNDINYINSENEIRSIFMIYSWNLFDIHYLMSCIFNIMYVPQSEIKKKILMLKKYNIL